VNYRHRMTIQVDNASDGTPDPDYVDYLAAVPCEIVPVGGGESYRGRQLEATTRYAIETRNYPGILPNMIGINDVTGAEYFFTKVIEKHGRLHTILIEATERVV